MTLATTQQNARKTIKLICLNMLSPLDYGYMKNTSSIPGVFVQSLKLRGLQAFLHGLVRGGYGSENLTRPASCGHIMRMLVESRRIVASSFGARDAGQIRPFSKRESPARW